MPLITPPAATICHAAACADISLLLLPTLYGCYAAAALFRLLLFSFFRYFRLYALSPIISPPCYYAADAMLIFLRRC